MNSKLSRIKEQWEVSRKKDEGCGPARSNLFGLDLNSDDFKEVHDTHCPLSLGAPDDWNCAYNCIFSAVPYDMDLMSTVLRTLEEACEQIN